MNINYAGPIPEMTRKVVSGMFYSGELEEEARIGHLSAHEMVLTCNKEQQEYMDYVVRRQGMEMYPHTQKRGCTERGMSLYIHV